MDLYVIGAIDEELDDVDDELLKYQFVINDAKYIVSL